MKRFLALAFTCFPFLCFGAPSISYTSYFNNTHTYTNATVASALRAGTVVATNGLTGQDLTASQATFTDANKKLVSTGTSAALSAALSDETGSGAAVFATAPTFSGITAGASTFSGEITSALGTIAADASALDATATWNNAGVTFTGLKLNITDTASAAASLLADLQVGGATMFRVDKTGRGRFAIDAWLQSSAQDRGLIMGSSGDLLLVWGAAATLQLGADAATPISQTIKGPDGVGTDKTGGSLTLEGGQSTGTAAAGAVVLKTANSAGASASTANSFSERFHAPAKWVTLTDATATTIFTIPVAATNYVGLTATVTIYATDGTDHQSKTSVITVDAIAKTTAITTTISQVDNTTAASAGTLTCTYTAVDNTSNVLAVKANATSSLTETVLRAKIVITAINSNGTATITEI